MIQIITIIILSIACLSLMGKFMIIPYIKKHKKLREKQAYEGRRKEIRKIVLEYLEELKN